MFNNIILYFKNTLIINLNILIKYLNKKLSPDKRKFFDKKFTLFPP